MQNSGLLQLRFLCRQIKNEMGAAGAARGGRPTRWGRPWGLLRGGTGAVGLAGWGRPWGDRVGHHHQHLELGVARIMGVAGSATSSSSSRSMAAARALTLSHARVEEKMIRVKSKDLSLRKGAGILVSLGVKIDLEYNRI
jgi:hypothetical protein